MTISISPVDVAEAVVLAAFAVDSYYLHRTLARIDGGVDGITRRQKALERVCVATNQIVGQWQSAAVDISQRRRASLQRREIEQAALEQGIDPRELLEELDGDGPSGDE